MSKFGETGVILRARVDQSLGTLDAETALIVGDILHTQDFRLLKENTWCHMAGLTSGEGEGLMFGRAAGDLSVAEITEALEVNGPIFSKQTPQQERSMRLVQILGRFAPSSQVATEGPFRDAKGGYMITSNPRWTYKAQTNGWRWFCYNMGSQLTTGSVLSHQTDSYGLWVN